MPDPVERSPILVLGYANVDLIASVAAIPFPGSRLTSFDTRTVAGGMAANCARAAAALGSHVVFLGKLGQGPLAGLITDGFAPFDIDLRWADTSHGPPTIAIILVTPDGDRTIVSQPTEYHSEGIRACLEHPWPRPGMLYVDGYHLGWAQAELRAARRKGFTIYCDLDGAADTYAPAEVIEYLDAVDILQANPTGLLRIHPGPDAPTACRELQSRAPTIICTQGPDPVLVFQGDDQTTLEVSASQPVKDTIGAGDILAGSILHALSSGSPINDAVTSAITEARHSTLYPGAVEGPLETLRHRLAKRVS